MTALLTVAGRNVLFAHWPVAPERLVPRLPGRLEPDTFDGSAWVSVLVIEDATVGPGSGPASVAFPGAGGTTLLNLRTYVRIDDDDHDRDHDDDDDTGVYFLSLDCSRRAVASVGRRVFGLPFHHARTRATRRDDEVTVRSRRSSRGDTAVFGARYRPAGPTFRAEPGTFEAFGVERFRYYLPASESRRVDAFAVGDAGGGRGRVRVGTIGRDPWQLRPAVATIRRNTLFEAAGLPTPASGRDPIAHYSPAFQMAVGPIETYRRSG